MKTRGKSWDLHYYERESMVEATMTKCLRVFVKNSQMQFADT